MKTVCALEHWSDMTLGGALVVVFAGLFGIYKLCARIESKASHVYLVIADTPLTCYVILHVGCNGSKTSAQLIQFTVL